MRVRHAPFADLLHDLEEPGCVACRRGQWSDERFVSAFVHDSYTNVDLRQRLDESSGFCPAHTRRLLATEEAVWVLGPVYADVFGSLGRRLDVGSRRGPDASCPMCESRAAVVDSVLRLLRSAIIDARVARAYEGNGGLCLAHVRAAARWTSPEGASCMASLLARQLSVDSDDSAPGEPLIGLDADATWRCAARAALSRISATLASYERDRPLLESIALRGTIDSCPLCLTRGLVEYRSIAWLAAESVTDFQALATEGISVCARHLHDLRADDPCAPTRVAQLARRQATNDLVWLRARLTPRSGGIRERLRRARYAIGPHSARTVGGSARVAALAVFGRRGAGLREALAAFGVGPRCFACDTASTAGVRETALLMAALRDRPTAARYEQSHGLCIRHALGLLHEVERGYRPEASADVVQLIRRVSGARAAVMRWELEEAVRRSAWAARHEDARGDASAWYRAPALLDGDVFLGAPAFRLAA